MKKDLKVMQDFNCDRFRNWLRAAAVDLMLPEPALSGHLAECANCGGLLTSAAAVLLPPPARDVGCNACRADLAALVDLETEVGALAAAQSYPHVWWHLLVCPQCASAYADIQLLRAALQTGLLAPPPRPRAVRPPQFAPEPFSRRYLHRLFAPYTTLGGTWGEPVRMHIRELRTDGHSITVHIAQTAVDAWEFGLTVQPPLSGWGLLNFGSTALRAPLDANGEAIFPALPQADLAALDGPDLVVQIEAADPPA